MMGSINNMMRSMDLDKSHKHLLSSTQDDITLAISDITELNENFLNITDKIHSNDNRHKRSLLPLGGLFSFLFGTADQKDLNDIKKDVQTIYDNQVNQAEVLNDIVSITNISRSLIKENREKINDMLENIGELYQNLDILKDEMRVLFETRKFFLIYSEARIHFERLKGSIQTLKDDINRFNQILTMLTSGKLSPSLINPTHLQIELESIQKQLPPTITLPEDPTQNIWHYYKYLTLNYIPLEDKIIMLVKIPLVDNQSALSLYKIYNLPVYNPKIDKSLKYNIEGNSIAISSDMKYATIPSDSEFMECTLASGHFCSLRSALYHMHYSNLCITSLFLKNDDLINENCEMNISNVTSPEAIYLDDGNWAIATMNSDQMEITCTDQKHVVSLNPPLSLVKLQPACTAFSSKLKLPPYFRKYSQGFANAMKEANLHLNRFETTDFRIWNSLNITNISTSQMLDLKELKPVKSIPVKILKAKIKLIKMIDSEAKTKYWIYIGGGSGSGILLLVMVCLCVYCKCKKHSNCLPRSTSKDKDNTDTENPSMSHVMMGAIQTDKLSDCGLQSSEKPKLRVKLQEPLSPHTSRLITLMEKYGADTSKYHKTSGSVSMESESDL